MAVMLIPPLGGPERKLTEMMQASGGLSWTPDGKWLAFGARDSPKEPIEHLGDLGRNRRASPADHVPDHSPGRRGPLWATITRPSRRMAGLWHSPGR